MMGQLGTRTDTRRNLPLNYFDIICSVSMLEEMASRETIVSILGHAYALLAGGGGVLANTHDIVLGDPTRPKLQLDCEQEAGFPHTLSDRDSVILSAPSDYLPWYQALLENPTQAMLSYNVGEADRTYSGHWSTLFSSVQEA
jgi:hypothetical protein